MTEASDLATASLIALPATHSLGLILAIAIAIVVAAFLTVMHHRDYACVPSLGSYLALLGAAKT